jgi:hypothetical protein
MEPISLVFVFAPAAIRADGATRDALLFHSQQAACNKAIDRIAANPSG